MPTYGLYLSTLVHEFSGIYVRKLSNKFNKNISILCSGSDGIDGNSDANGAFVDFEISEKIKKLNLNANEYLKNCDSNTFFNKLSYDFVTGITGTNVMDFIIVLKEKNNG